MRILQATIGTSPAPLFPTEVAPGRALPFCMIILQNNGTATIRIGDNTVTTDKGISVPPSAASVIQLTPALQYSGDLYEFWGVGSAATVLDIMLLD